MNEQRLVETFLRLVRVNSPSRRESAAMAVAEAHFQRLGFTVQFDDAGAAIGGDTGNLIARRAGSAAAEPIFLNAHIDTVQPTEGIVILHEDGVIRTDGTTVLGADDKAGVACILEAIEALDEEGAPTPPIEVVITIAEEIGLLGSRHFDASRIRARSGWVVDSGQPLNAVITESPSQDKLEFAIHGRAAHAGARPEEGISAIGVAARAISAMPLGRLDFETTANVGTIQGGQATNIVAPECRFDAEARSRDNAKLDAQVKAMVAAVETAAKEAGALVDINIERVFDAFSANPDGREVRIVSEAMRSLGMEPTLQRTGGGMDANNFAKQGMRCVVIGCGYKDIHTTAESIATADMAAGARTLAETIRRAA
ncbi:MAG TPA: M20/M25/M40 family metallo-hydrolase [Armatimonadota bacterium]